MGVSMMRVVLQLVELCLIACAVAFEGSAGLDISLFSPVAQVDGPIAPAHREEQLKGYAPSSKPRSTVSVLHPPLASPTLPPALPFPKSREFGPSLSPKTEPSSLPGSLLVPPPSTSGRIIASPPPRYSPINAPAIILAPAPTSTPLNPPPPFNPPTALYTPPPLNPTPIVNPPPTWNPPPPLSLSPPMYVPPPPPPFPANDTGPINSPPTGKRGNVPPESSPEEGASAPTPTSTPLNPPPPFNPPTTLNPPPPLTPTPIVNPPPPLSLSPPMYLPPPPFPANDTGPINSPPTGKRAPTSTPLNPPPPLTPTPIVNPPPPLNPPPSLNPPPPLSLSPPMYLPPPPFPANDTGPINLPPTGKRRNVPPKRSPEEGASAPGSYASSPTRRGRNVPAKKSSVLAPPVSDHHGSPVSPPQTRHKMPSASPPNDTHRPLPSMQRSSPKARPNNKILPHMADVPSPSVLSAPSKGYGTPLSSPEGSPDAVSPSTHPSIHRSHGAPMSSPSSPSTDRNHSFATSPLMSFDKHHHSRNKIINTPPPWSLSPSSGPQVLPPGMPPKSGPMNNSPPSISPGSSIFPPHLTSPPPVENEAPAPSPFPEVGTGSNNTNISPPEHASTRPKMPPVRPILSLPPPPPNEDCLSTTCTEPYTNTPPGSPCGCVWPMQVGLSLNVALYTFFPLVSELADEIAAGVFMKQSQVRIMGANAATDQPEKTIVLIDLVPLGGRFDNMAAFLTYQRFWHKVVVIKATEFGDYEVLYVRYPGLPPSPPLPPSDINVIDGGPYTGNDNNARTNKPLGVDPLSRQHNNRLSSGAVAIIVLSALVAVILCSVVAWILVLRRRERGFEQEPTPRGLLPSVGKSAGIVGTVLGSGPGSASLSFGSSIPPYTGSAKTFSATDMEKATDNFDPSRVLGEGGFGRVYSGTLEDGTKVAVKVLKRDDQHGSREFLAEVEMLSRLHHRNLVKLIGICTEERLRCLVYELIPNGSVESHLHGVDKESAPLNWEARMKVALGAARGLAYLHEDSSPRVIHRDFKASNILLEHDFTPKVSDFGLARTALDEENRHISTRVMGTFGYVAPEYAMTGHLLVKSDVYSYGVVLLELLTGRKPVDMSQPPGQENLVTWARPLLTSRDGLESILDSSLGPNVPFDSVAKVAAIASMCVQPEVSHRPFMGEVVQALKLVCNECNEAEGGGGGSRSSSREDLSIDLGAGEGGVSGQLQLPDPLQSRYSDPNFDSLSYTERGILISDLLGSASTRYGGHISGSFRCHSNSGPLRSGRDRHFWQRLRRLSGGSASEHAADFRLWPGSH